MAWLVAKGRPKGLRSFAYLTLSSMQYCAAPSEDAACRMRFSCTKCCATSKPFVRVAEGRIARNVNVGERDTRMVGRHIEGPKIFFDFEALAFHRNDKAG